MLVTGWRVCPPFYFILQKTNCWHYAQGDWSPLILFQSSPNSVVHTMQGNPPGFTQSSPILAKTFNSSKWRRNKQRQIYRRGKKVGHFRRSFNVTWGQTCDWGQNVPLVREVSHSLFVDGTAGAIWLYGREEIAPPQELPWPPATPGSKAASWQPALFAPLERRPTCLCCLLHGATDPWRTAFCGFRSWGGPGQAADSCKEKVQHHLYYWTSLVVLMFMSNPFTVAAVIFNSEVPIVICTHMFLLSWILFFFSLFC